MKVCSSCNRKYDDKIPHYCVNCGRNLSGKLEKTDIILFLSNFCKVIGFMGICVFTLPLASCAINPVCIDGSCSDSNYSTEDWIFIFMPVFILIIGFILKIFFKKICLKNIKKE